MATILDTRAGGGPRAARTATYTKTCRPEAFFEQKKRQRIKWRLLLFQHQLALLTNHALCSMGKAREQPRQHNLKTHGRLVDIDDAGRTLAKRSSAEGQTVARPDLFLQR